MFEGQAHSETAQINDIQTNLASTEISTVDSQCSPHSAYESDIVTILKQIHIVIQAFPAGNSILSATQTCMNRTGFFHTAIREHFHFLIEISP